MASVQKGMSPFAWFVVVISSILTFYLMFNYLGPFAWLAALQLRWFGVYDEKITFLLTFLLIAGVVGLIAFPIRKLHPNLTSENQNLNKRAGSLIVQIIGLGFAVGGLIELYKARQIGAQVTITAAQLEAGEKPGSSWVSVAGFAMNDTAMTFESGSSKYRYVPIVSTAAGPQGTAAKLICKIRDSDSLPGDDSHSTTYAGILAHDDLPGPVRVAYQKDGAISGNDYDVLELSATPALKRTNAKIMMYVGGGVAVLGMILGMVRRLKEKKGPPMTV